MQDKKTLFTIIGLLAIFLPLSIIGTINNLKSKNVVVDDNPNKDFIYNDTVYFYDDNGSLIDKYSCSNCSRSETIIDDEAYHTNYYKNGTKSFGPTIDSMYGTFKKDERIAIYSLVSHGIVTDYEKIKNYNTDHTNQVIITYNNKKYGATYLDGSNSGLKSEYDYIAIPAHFKNNLLDTSMFIGKINDLWYLLDSSGNAIMRAVEKEIVDFNSLYYITYDGEYHIFDYEGNEYLNSITKNNVYGIDKYLFVDTSSELLMYGDINEGIKESIKLSDYKDIYFSLNDNEITIMKEGKVLETIALS